MSSNIKRRMAEAYGCAKINFPPWLTDEVKRKNHDAYGYYKHASILLYDALRFYNGEKLNKSQIAVVDDILEKIRTGNVNLRDFRQMDRDLLKVGLDSIPSGEEE
jgi:hypothetical protein